MRQVMVALGLLALAGCAQQEGSYDPHLYDANGNVITPAAAPPAAPTPAPPPPPPPPAPPQAAAPAPECRDVERTVMIGGQPHSALARACRQPDGSWGFVE